MLIILSIFLLSMTATFASDTYDNQTAANEIDEKVIETLEEDSSPDTISKDYESEELNENSSKERELAYKKMQC